MDQDDKEHFKSKNMVDLEIECDTYDLLRLRQGWGHWHYTPEPFPALTYVEDHGVEMYWFDLRKAKSSAQLLDWIFQFEKKAWASPQDVHDLIKALDQLIEPQATLCSFGKSKSMTRSDLENRLKIALKNYP